MGCYSERDAFGNADNHKYENFDVTNLSDALTYEYSQIMITPCTRPVDSKWRHESGRSSHSPSQNFR